MNELTQRSLILASASPRRRELIEQLGLTAHVKSADIDETPHAGEDTGDYVLRLSLDKAGKVANQISTCLLYTSPSPRDRQKARMPSSA